MSKNLVGTFLCYCSHAIEVLLFCEFFLQNHQELIVLNCLYLRILLTCSYIQNSCRIYNWADSLDVFTFVQSLYFELSHSITCTQCGIYHLLTFSLSFLTFTFSSFHLHKDELFNLDVGNFYYEKCFSVVSYIFRHIPLLYIRVFPEKGLT